MNIKLKSKFPLINNDDVCSFCNKKKIELPREYIEFLLQINGGIPANPVFTWIDEKGQESSGVIQYFIPLRHYKYDLCYYYTVYHNRLPDDLFPFAADPFGNLICVGCNSRKLGEIFYWDHEYELDKIVYKVKYNKSLSDFIDHLQPQEQEETELDRINKIVQNGSFEAIKNYINDNPQRINMIYNDIIRYNKKRALFFILNEKGCQRGMMCAAARYNNVEMLDILYQKGSDINENINGTPLMDAILANSHDAIRFLLDKGADICQKDKTGRTAADIARMFSNNQTRKVLQELIKDKTFLKKMESAI